MSRTAGTLELIDSKAVKSLVEARALRGATILGRPGGWMILVRYGTAERAIAGQKSHRARLWRHSDTAISFIREELGMDRFEVDAAEYDPAGQRTRRPDQAARLRQQREAADYDAWFRRQIQAGLDEAERGEVVPQEDVEADWERQRADLEIRIDSDS